MKCIIQEHGNWKIFSAVKTLRARIYSPPQFMTWSPIGRAKRESSSYVAQHVQTKHSDDKRLFSLSTSRFCRGG